MTPTPNRFVSISRGTDVVTVELVNSKSMNILGSGAIGELTRTFRNLAEEPGVRVIILRGSGDKAFIGGADIGEMATLDRAAGRAFIRGLAGLCEAIRDCPALVIARLAGWCLGGGLEVAMSCDLRVAGADAMFGMPEISVGIPSVIHAALMPSLIGASRTGWLLLTGETINAATAEQWGLVHTVVPSDHLDTRIADLAARITSFGPEVVRQQKRLLNKWFDMTSHSAISDSIEEFGLAFLTGEPQRYMTQFLERRRMGL